MSLGWRARSIPLTADLVGRAVIAAARAYGDDPVTAMTCHRTHTPRRVLSAVGSALAKGGVDFDQVERMLGVKRSTIYAARSKRAGAFDAAEDMAARTLVADAAPPVEVEDVVEVVEAGGCAPAVEIVRAPRAPIAKPARLRTLTAAAVRREILGVLALEPCAAPDLIEILSVSEAQVRQGLRELAEAQEVAHDALTAEGWRVQTWRLPR
jgi:hypothetical protein